VNKAQDYYPSCPEAMIISLARTGDSGALEELVRRRQSWIRNLMRRFCGDNALADDLAQQVFLQLWLKIRMLKKANAFGAWLKRLAVTVWLQHLRKHDALHDAEDLSGGGINPSRCEQRAPGFGPSPGNTVHNSTLMCCSFLS